MMLSDLLKGLHISSITGDAATEITGVSYDSRRAEKGHLFIAMKGEKADGHAFVPNAVRNGAVAVIHDADLAASAVAGGADVCLVRVRDSREAMARIANNYYREPSRSLTVIGVTGTNGKTTTTYIVKSILEAWGKKTGLIGTIQYLIGDEVFTASHTTPEALEFQGLLHCMLASGCTHVITEVSSHALAQRRVDGTVFRTGVFTNLTRDHLDYHSNMDDYFLAKQRLFAELLDRSTAAVINYDDPWGRKLIPCVSGESITYGLETGSDLMATDVNNSFEGLRFSVLMHGTRHNVVSPLMGLPNVYNILAAAGVCTSLGVPWSVILEGIRNSGTIRGRFEKVDAGQGFLAVVDFAHTEDALERLIYTARGLAAGKIITVFGCGGDRDRGKRPIMGAVATRLSDFVIITSDNPRTERPEDIIGEIAAGAVRKNYLIEPDRKEAIKRAVLIAGENDIVLIAGKGHEDYQEIAGKKIRFIDREVLEEAIRQLAGNR